MSAEKYNITKPVEDIMNDILSTISHVNKKKLVKNLTELLFSNYSGFMSAAMVKGIENEPKILKAATEDLLKMATSSEEKVIYDKIGVCVHPQHDYIVASPDGRLGKKTAVIEIKDGSKFGLYGANMINVEKGDRVELQPAGSNSGTNKAPKKNNRKTVVWKDFTDQCQHLMLTCATNECHLVMSENNKSRYIHTFKVSRSWQQETLYYYNLLLKLAKALIPNRFVRQSDTQLEGLARSPPSFDEAFNIQSNNR